MLNQEIELTDSERKEHKCGKCLMLYGDINAHNADIKIPSKLINGKYMYMCYEHYVELMDDIKNMVEAVK